MMNKMMQWAVRSLMLLNYVLVRVEILVLF